MEQVEIASGKYGRLLNYRRGLDLNWLKTERWCLLWMKVYWEAQLDREHPLMWMDKKGTLYRPCSDEVLLAGKLVVTDLGSVPPFVQQHAPAAEMPWAYFFHDMGYRFHGLWVKTVGAAAGAAAATEPAGAAAATEPWEFRKMTRAELDDLCLRQMPEAMGVSLVRRNLIYDCVRAGGWAAWKT
jgi:hypothetical protein